MNYQAKISTPFGVLGILCTQEALTGIEFLGPQIQLLSPRTACATKVCEQLSAYIADANFHFDLPLQPGGTIHQNKVWQALRTIPCGQVKTYGEVALQLGSGARAVGQACGNNPIPIIIPCHRVVGKSGLVGFMHQSAGHSLDIKRWLLQHES
jgi:methylated-DNA-[protein]-cysteine S-methyltransferase